MTPAAADLPWASHWCSRRIPRGRAHERLPVFFVEQPSTSVMLPYLLVGLGGFIGANARFVISRVVGELFETKFPLATFVINVSGSFLLGVLGTIVAQKVMPTSEATRLALGVGFLGAF